MPGTYTASRQVEFGDTDAAGIMHFSRFFTLMEEAEHEFLRHLDLSVYIHDAQTDQTISWPRVSAECQFQGAVRFEQQVDIRVTILRIGTKSVTYGFEFLLQGTPVAEGKITSVCCRIVPHQAPESIVIPDWIAEKLRPFAAP